MTTTWLKAKNRAFSTLATSVTDAGTSWVVAAGEGSLFPSSTPFNITCENEIVKCTNRVADTLTVTRAQEGTTAVTHGAGAAVQLRITAQMLTELQEGKTRSAECVIAPSTASDAVKNGADIICTGLASGNTDDVIINDALATYRDILLLGGSYYLYAPIEIVDTSDTWRLTFLGKGYQTCFVAMASMNYVVDVSCTTTPNAAINYATFGNFRIDGNGLAVKGVYGESVSRSECPWLMVTGCTDWGVHIVYNHSAHFGTLICNNNGSGTGVDKGGLKVGDVVGGVSAPFSVLQIDLLITESNTGDGAWFVEGDTITISTWLTEGNTRNGGRAYSGITSRVVSLVVVNMYTEGNNTSKGGTGIADLLIEDAVSCSVLGGRFDATTDTTYNIRANTTGSGSAAFFLGNVSMNRGCYVDCDTFSTTQTATNAAITIGTSVREVKTGGWFETSVELDLSGASTNTVWIPMRRFGYIVSVLVAYTEASSADAGVVIRLGRIQDGVALDDDYYFTKTSEISKALGYQKFYYGADFAQQYFDSGDTITVGTAGGKTGTGNVKLKIQYFQGN